MEVSALAGAVAGLTNCRFEVQGVTQLPFREEFDLVVSVDNLEHVEADVAAMENLRRVLVPGGRLVVHVPGSASGATRPSPTRSATGSCTTLTGSC